MCVCVFPLKSIELHWPISHSLDGILPHKQNSKGKGFNLPSALGSVISNSLLETWQTQSIYSPFFFCQSPEERVIFHFPLWRIDFYFIPFHRHRCYKNVMNVLHKGLF